MRHYMSENLHGLLLHGASLVILQFRARDAEWKELFKIDHRFTAKQRYTVIPNGKHYETLMLVLSLSNGFGSFLHTVSYL